MAMDVSFKQGNKENYLAIDDKDTGTLYWCLNTQELFKGGTLFSIHPVIHLSIVGNNADNFVVTMGNIYGIWDENLLAYTISVPEFGNYIIQIASKLSEDIRTIEVLIDECKVYNIKSSLGIYGVSWDKGPNSIMARTDDATFFVEPNAATSLQPIGFSPFDEVPIWKEIALVEKNGIKMVKIPKFYYKYIVSEFKTTLQITDIQKEGFFVSPAHADRQDGYGERDFVYIAQDMLANSHDPYAPLRSLTIPQAREECSALGEGFFLWDYAMYCTIAMLYLIEFANWNSQLVIGSGGSSAGANTETTDMIYHTGINFQSRTNPCHVKYRHIDNLWSGNFCWIDGIYVSDGSILINSGNPSLNNTIEAYTIKLTNTAPLPSNGRIVGYTQSQELPWVIFPNELTPDFEDNTYITDNIYFIDKNAHYLFSGCGAQNNHPNRGLFYCGVGIDSVGNAARAMYLPRGEE